MCIAILNLLFLFLFVKWSIFRESCLHFCKISFIYVNRRLSYCCLCKNPRWELWAVEILAFPLTWHIAYTTACCYRTSPDVLNYTARLPVKLSISQVNHIFVIVSHLLHTGRNSPTVRQHSADAESSQVVVWRRENHRRGLSQ